MSGPFEQLRERVEAFARIPLGAQSPADLVTAAETLHRVSGELEALKARLVAELEARGIPEPRHTPEGG